MIKCKNACPTGQFEGCCFECGLKENCEEACQLNPSECGDSIMEDTEEVGLQAFKQGQMAVLKQIADIITTKKKLEEQEAELKAKLKEARQLKLGPKENITFFHYTSISGGCKWKLESLNLN